MDSSGIRARRRGSLLVAVTVGVAVMAALLAVGYLAVRQRSLLAKGRLDAVLLDTSAAEVIRIGLARLAEDPDLAVDSRLEPWAEATEIELPNGVAVALSIEDENRRFDLNNLAAGPFLARPARAILDDLLTLCGDLHPSRRLDPLEAWLRGEGPPNAEWPSPGPRLRSWPELLMSPGFDLDYLELHSQGDGQDTFRGRLLDHLTLIPVDRAQPVPVNLNTAGRHVLLAVLGIAEEPLVVRILTTRSRVALPSVALAVENRPDLLPVAERYLSVRSTHFTLRARAYLGGQSRQAEALVERTPEGSVRVLRWQEGPSA